MFQWGFFFCVTRLLSIQWDGTELSENFIQKTAECFSIVASFGTCVISSIHGSELQVRSNAQQKKKSNDNGGKNT
jgi:hypothetical protein